MMKLALIAAAAACASAQLQEITSLPGFPQPWGTKMYSGYVTVNATAGRRLFGWVVQSATDPANAPLVYWTNGGPGCSGVGGGLFSESGPFRPDANGNLYANPWSWHTAGANVVYIEQPAGVGFSYSNTPSDYTVGDARAAEDAYQFLQGLLSQPEFSSWRDNPLWISGESYGGHYIPTTSAAIVRHNLAKDDPRGPLNFAGFLVGNAWTEATYDNTGALTIWHNRGMISDAVFNGVLATCNMSDVGPLMARYARKAGFENVDHMFGGVPSVQGVALPAHPELGFRSKEPVNGKLPTYKAQDCNYWTSLATTQQGNTDIYQVFANVLQCPGGPSASKGKAASKAVSASAGIVDSNGQSGCAVDYDPCIDGKTGAYLNRADVQAAIHVNASTIPGGSWVGCSAIVNYSYSDLLSSMFPVYSYLLDNAPEATFWVYSGDVDGIVPFPGTRAWMTAFASQYGLTEQDDFHPWNTPDGQVGGWTYTFTSNNGNGAELHFASVRNAGHLVPTTQGSRGLQMFQTIITNGQL